MVEMDSYRTAVVPAFETLKTTHFDGDIDEPVILHREDMMAKRGPFAVLRDSEASARFRQALLAFVGAAAFSIIAVVVDKENTRVKSYGAMASHPYHIGLLAMLERYAGRLKYLNAEGDVLAESRGAREDSQLKSAYRTVYDSGTRFRDAQFFQSALTSKEIKIKPKSQNIVGLQMADIFAYPAKRKMLYEAQRGTQLTGFTTDLATALEPKYNKRTLNGQVSGYGKVFLG